MSDDWRKIIPKATQESYVTEAVWERRVVDAEEPELTEEEIVATDPQWTPPDDLWAPARTLGPISTDPPASSG